MCPLARCDVFPQTDWNARIYALSFRWDVPTSSVDQACASCNEQSRQAERRTSHWIVQIHTRYSGSSAVKSNVHCFRLRFRWGGDEEIVSRCFAVYHRVGVTSVDECQKYPAFPCASAPRIPLSANVLRKRYVHWMQQSQIPRVISDIGTGYCRWDEATQ